MPRNCWTRCNKTFPCSFPAREKTREIESRETSKRLEKQAILALLRKMIYKGEFANIAQKCFQNLANKKSVWSLCKVVQTKKTSHKVRGVLLREGLYKAFASCLSSAAVSGFLSSSSIFAASLSSLSVTAVSAVLGSVSSTGSGVLEE